MKMTKKFSKAMETALNAEILGRYEHVEDQEWLYRKLNDAGHFWDAKVGRWVEFRQEPANAPTPLIRVRVWSESGAKLDEAVSQVKSAFANGYEIINQSAPYVCRPPQQLEGRVYLEFRRVNEMTADELQKENDPYGIEI